jgi:hypothetical protein
LNVCGFVHFVPRALQFPPEAWLRMSPRHGSITWLTIRPSGRVVLQSLGDSGHMPPDKLSVSSVSSNLHIFLFHEIDDNQEHPLVKIRFYKT